MNQSKPIRKAEYPVGPVGTKQKYCLGIRDTGFLLIGHKLLKEKHSVVRFMTGVYMYNF